MKSTEVFDEEEVKILLLGNKNEIGEALKKIQGAWEKPICAWIRKKNPGIFPEDLADIWQETLLGILKAVTNERFNPEGSLKAWVTTIARNRTYDRYRRKHREEKALNAIGAALKMTETGAKWREINSKDRAETLSLLRAEISKLPYKQRVVIRVFVEGYPETDSMEILRLEVSKITKEEETRASVTRALQEARKKMRTKLDINH